MFETLNDIQPDPWVTSLGKLINKHFQPFTTNGVTIAVVYFAIDYRQYKLRIEFETLPNDQLVLDLDYDAILDQGSLIMKSVSDQIRAFFERIYIQPESNILLGEN